MFVLTNPTKSTLSISNGLIDDRRGLNELTAIYCHKKFPDYKVNQM